MTLNAVSRQLLGPTVSEAVEHFRRPSLPPGVRYALLLRLPRRAHAKPLAFAGLADLARHLHRARGEAGLQLVDSELITAERPGEPLAGVSLWTLDPATQDRRCFLGWAWLAGAGRPTLEAALQAEQPGPVH